MAQSVVVRGRDPDGNSADLNLDEDGNLKIAGTFSSGPPVGGATEAKQDDQIDLLGGGLPAALTAGGGVKTGLVDAIPAGTNLIGRVASDTSATSTLSNVAASASNVTILASNASRKRVVIVNDSTATLYLKFGTTASATSYTYILYGGDTYESPSNPIYTGQIDGIWASATGAARVTEMT